MTNPAFPQYAKSEHPDVIAAIRETARLAKEFYHKLDDLSEEITGGRGNGYLRGNMFDQQFCSGFDAKAVKEASAPGQWTKPEGGVTRPYKSNPLWQKMKDLGFTAPDIPGRENLMWGVGYMGTGIIFELEGWAYSGISFQLHPMSEKLAAAAEEFGWTEIMPSEFHKAMETENARRAALRGGGEEG